jgi:hypothetical protein
MCNRAYFGMCEDEIVIKRSFCLEVRRTAHEAFYGGDVGSLLRRIEASPFQSL